MARGSFIDAAKHMNVKMGFRHKRYLGREPYRPSPQCRAHEFHFRRLGIRREAEKTHRAL